MIRLHWSGRELKCLVHPIATLSVCTLRIPLTKKTQVDRSSREVTHTHLNQEGLCAPRKAEKTAHFFPFFFLTRERSEIVRFSRAIAPLALSLPKTGPPTLFARLVHVDPEPIRKIQRRKLPPQEETSRDSQLASTPGFYDRT